MKRTSLAELGARFGRREAILLPWLLGSTAGLVVSFTTLVVGWMLELLIRASISSTLPETIQLSPQLSLSTVWLDAEQGPLRGVLALLVLALGLVVLEATILFLLYRWAIHYAIECEIQLRRSVYEKSMLCASSQSVVGQQAIRSESSSYWIPQIRDALLAWYRTVPRHSIQATACFFFALLIHPTLMILAAIAFVLLWQLYVVVDRQRRSLQPVLTERRQMAQDRLVAMAEIGPLVSAVIPGKIHSEEFESRLRTYREAEFKLFDSFLWKTPLLLIVVSLMLSVFCLALSVRILQNTSSLGVAGALTMLVLIGFGYVSVIKARRAWARVRSADASASRLLNSLIQMTAAAQSLTSSKTATALTEGISIEHVTLKDTQHHTLLDDVTFQARPGMLVAIVATSQIEAKTLGELLLGFGSPASGRIVWDSTNAAEFNAESLQRQCLWISPNGPMTAGTLIENLSFPDRPKPLADIVDAARIAGAYDTVSELSDMFSTFISPNDDRLKNDSLFQLGIARGLLRKPSIVVAEEPTDRVSAATESQSAYGLRQLTQRGAIVFVISQRPTALRVADLVILLHEKRVVGSGKHQELLEQSELYRHFNYLKFSPLRDTEIR
ncbi:MAG: ABC transporter ATP-binding protein [Pirellulaceae bacterium]|nr:ABC transporter ATP-binding protein [Pirellulaceae bacterium]